MKKINLHTHTFRCRHAIGTVDGYCAEAVKQGISVLGFSDHQPFPDDRFPQTRMDYADMPAYLEEIEAAKALFPQLKLLRAVECEYDPAMPASFYREYREKFALDYLIGSVHFVTMPDGNTVGISRKTVIGNAEVRAFMTAYLNLLEYGSFLFLAHPDMCAIGIDRPTPEMDHLFRELITAAKAKNVPLEINAYGLRKPPVERSGGIRAPYPWLHFWELAAEIGVSCVVNSDAHRPADVWGNTDDALEIARKFNLSVVNEHLSDALLDRK